MKNRAIWSLALAAVSLAFGACSPKPSSTSGTRIAVIPKGTTHEFWQSIHAGAIKAQNELKEAGEEVEIIWQGPLKEDDREQQLQIVERFTVKRVSAIVLAPLDDQALVSPVRTATEAGIPVVVIDSGLKSDDYVSFVATDNYKGGVMAAEHMVELLGGSGNVMVLRYQVGSASTTKRENGFIETMAKHSGITVISSDQYAGATRNKALDKSESLLNSPLGSQVNGIFCPNETVSTGMVQALKTLNKAGGQVKVIGFDTGRQSVEDMKNGDLQGLIVQNPIRMGYLGVKTAVEQLKTGKVEKRIDTGVSLITPANMNDPAMTELLNPPIDKYLKK